jgi:hypothetical protein
MVPVKFTPISEQMLADIFDDLPEFIGTQVG